LPSFSGSNFGVGHGVGCAGQLICCNAVIRLAAGGKVGCAGSHFAIDGCINPAGARFDSCARE